MILAYLAHGFEGYHTRSKDTFKHNILRDR